MTATASDVSAANTLEKTYRDMDKNIKPSYYDTHKIQNGEYVHENYFVLQ